MTPPQRRAAGRWQRAAALAFALFVCGASLPAAAQSISYTVQVVALSDRDAALGIQGELLREGFPAYVVRSTSTQGDVFRVRVGAFANRPAALRYAEAMPEVAGGQPVPALAEAIPSGVTPLAPRLLLELPVTGLDVRLLEYGEELVVRTQQRSPLTPAVYHVIGAGAVERVRAWQLAEEPGGARLWVRDMPLWPETWQEDSEEVRDGYRSSLVSLMAERLGVETSVVEGAQYRGPAGVPHLVVVERMAPELTDGVELLGLGLPSSGMTPSGPLAYLGIDAEALPGLPEGVRVAEAPEGAVEADAWSATADGPFVRLTVAPMAEGAGARSWRAAFGTPHWSDGHHLVAFFESVMLIYDFLPRD